VKEKPVIYCIYNANGTILGKFEYLIKKIFMDFHCTMCDISHSMVTEKEIWKKKLKESKYPIFAVHKDEQPIKLRDFSSDSIPCVILYQDNYFKILIDSDELISINGKVDDFFELLNKKLSLAENNQ
tara:strand:- start:496 stop:876 length:381 start_codon:yes stop_codon:yes gene_type:complete